MIVAIDPMFSRHNPGAGHPERPERILALLRMLQDFPHRGEMEFVSPRPASWKQVGWVHRREYLDQLRQIQGSRVVLDPDTVTSEESVETALLAAGSAVAVAERVSESGRPGFAMIRPPGHHAEADHAMGFCLLNNVAIAAEWALREAGARRVAVIDFDVHHGNGTQHSFYERKDVLYISSHQYPLYPGTGTMNENGSGPGEGFTVNLPLRAGLGDPTFAKIYQDTLPLLLEQYGPDWILVSAGYDAHRDDPLAGMKVTAPGFARTVQSLQRCAREFCKGRIVYLLEGGYNLAALSASVSESLSMILGKSKLEMTPLPEPPEWKDYLTEFRRFQPHWRF